MSTPRILTLPPGAHRTTIPTPSGPIAALAAGPVGGAPDRHTAVLVPGFTGSKEDFIALLGPLAQAGRRVYAIDLPGQYQSPGSDTLDAYSCAALGRAVAEVIAALEQGPVHLLGHSFGGLVTRETVLSTAVPLLSHALLGSGPSGVEGSRREDALRLIAALGPSPPGRSFTGSGGSTWKTSTGPAGCPRRSTSSCGSGCWPTIPWACSAWRRR